jgi:hypothetical protein
MKLVFFVLFLNVLSLVIFISPISFTGFYSDIVFLFFTMAWSVFLIFTKIPLGSVKKALLKFILVMMMGMEMMFLIFFWKLGSFKVQNVSSFTIDNTNRKYTVKNAYFNYKSVGCGMGTYWETITLKHFPVIEYRTYINKCSHFIVEGNRIK